MTTDYERGRLAGFAEGVEAAARVYESQAHPRKDMSEAIRALRARDPAAESMPCPNCGRPFAPTRDYLLACPHADPSPKEDAPRCLVCGGAGRGTVFAMDGNCPACGGTGRSTTGGGR